MRGAGFRREASRATRCPLLVAAMILSAGAALAQSFPVAVWYGGGKARAPTLV